MTQRIGHLSGISEPKWRGYVPLDRAITGRLSLVPPMHAFERKGNAHLAKDWQVRQRARERRQAEAEREHARLLAQYEAEGAPEDESLGYRPARPKLTTGQRKERQRRQSRDGHVRAKRRRDAAGAMAI